MTSTDYKRASEREVDTSKGPASGQSRTAPKADPADGAEISDLTKDRQPATGPKG
jgi:hypothetical protein